jgi:hypothetical protein
MILLTIVMEIAAEGIHSKITFAILGYENEKV